MRIKEKKNINHPSHIKNNIIKKMNKQINVRDKGENETIKILESQHNTTKYRTQDQRERGISTSPPGQDLFTARLRPTKS